MEEKRLKSSLLCLAQLYMFPLGLAYQGFKYFILCSESFHFEDMLA
jgi:hypothetical protein